MICQHGRWEGDRAEGKDPTNAIIPSYAAPVEQERAVKSSLRMQRKHGKEEKRRQKCYLPLWRFIEGFHPVYLEFGYPNKREVE